jgi:hypothetical protein
MDNVKAVRLNVSPTEFEAQMNMQKRLETMVTRLNRFEKQDKSYY